MEIEENNNNNKVVNNNSKKNLIKFVEEKFLELGSSPQNKINLRCNDAAQANVNKLDLAGRALEPHIC